MIRNIDAYLDRLFDLLAGSGAAGRRLLQETEGHLNAALTEEMAGGHDKDEAAALAIARFGTPEEVSAAHVRHTRLPAAVAAQRLGAAAWFFIGVTGAVLGLAGLLSAGFALAFGPSFVASDPHIGYASYMAERCVELSALYPGMTDCHAMHDAYYVDATIRVLIFVGGLGAAMLLAFWLMRRSPYRAFTILPNATMVAAVGAVGFGLIGFLGLGFGVFMLTSGIRPGTGGNLAIGLAALTAFILFLPRAWRQLRLE